MKFHFMPVHYRTLLALFCFFYDVRACTFVNFMRSFIMVFHAMVRGFRFSALGVFCAWVVMVNTVVLNTFVFMMRVVMCLMTLHGLSSSEVVVLGEAKQTSR